MEPDMGNMGNMGMEQQMMGNTGLEPPPQFKEEPPENWQVRNQDCILLQNSIVLVACKSSIYKIFTFTFSCGTSFSHDTCKCHEIV